jgi:hypothetical protein
MRLRTPVASRVAALSVAAGPQPGQRSMASSKPLQLAGAAARRAERAGGLRQFARRAATGEA